MVYLIWLTYLLIGFWAPWWSSLALVFAVGAVSRSWQRGFINGFGGGFLIWLLITGYFNFRGHNIVATRLGLLFGGLSPQIFHLVISLMAGLIHGLIGLCGYAALGGLTVMSSSIETANSKQA